jgi:hypothetical protein
MPETRERQGSCACGAVRIIARHASSSVGACHCRTCVKWNGGPFMAVSCGTDVVFDGAEHIALFDSSAWAERGFCNRCGSHLFYRIKQTGQHEVLAGIFDEHEGLVFDHQVFVDERPAYYAFANQTEELTGAECFARFASAAR